MARHPLRRGGFTLIEVMITVAIVAILAAVAYPSYRDQVAKGRRAEARTVLMDGAQWMERHYSENYRYDKNTANVAVGTLFAAQYSGVPASGPQTYTLGFEGLAASTYRLVATRTGSMANDRCGDFVITHTGAKGMKNFDTSAFANEAAAVQACW